MELNSSKEIINETSKNRTSKIEFGSNQESQNVSDLLSIQFEEVKDDSNSDLQISSSKNLTQEEVKIKLYEELKSENWWLQDEWRRKGIPKEQFTISLTFGDIQVYNFGDNLSKKHIQKLQETIDILSKLKDTPLKRIKYIIFDNERKLNPNTGEYKCGQHYRKLQSIVICIDGLSFEKHRIPESSIFEGTLIHEFSHNFSIEIIEKWKKEFGWEELENPIELPGGNYKYYEILNPKECVSDYSEIRPDEDFCESMVAAIKSPNILDPKRLSFIQKNIFFGNHSQEALITRKEKISLPKIKQPIKYKIKLKKFKIEEN